MLQTSHSPNPRPFEPLLSLEQAAKLLGLHPDTLKKKAQRREIPGFKIGKRWGFRASLLDAWVRSKLISRPTPITPRSTEKGRHPFAVHAERLPVR
jgi:excisionase family DNA binding protein